MTNKKSYTNQRQRILIIVTAIAFGALWVTHLRPPRAKFPSELIGTWKTASQQYADRSLEIDSISINFGTGPGTVSTWFIEKIESSLDNDGTLYKIDYVADNVHEQASILYKVIDGKETIRFANHRDVIWEKVDGD